MKGAIKSVPDPIISKGFYSVYFLIPKKGGGLRPILALHLLNTFIKKIEFHIVTLASIILSLHQGACCTAVVMKDMYFHIDNHVAHHNFLYFHVGNNHYQFRVLPYSIVLAPRVFTVVAAQLR